MEEILDELKQDNLYFDSEEQYKKVLKKKKKSKKTKVVEEEEEAPVKVKSKKIKKEWSL